MPFTFNASDVNASQPVWKHLTLTQGSGYSPTLQASTKLDVQFLKFNLPPPALPWVGLELFPDEYLQQTPKTAALQLESDLASSPHCCHIIVHQQLYSLQSPLATALRRGVTGEAEHPHMGYVHFGYSSSLVPPPSPSHCWGQERVKAAAASTAVQSYAQTVPTAA